MESKIIPMEGNLQLIQTPSGEGFLVNLILLKIADVGTFIKSLGNKEEVTLDQAIAKGVTLAPDPPQEVEEEDTDADDLDEEDTDEEDTDGPDAEEEDFYTREEILEMKRDVLMELIELNDLDIDPEDFPKTAKLREEVIAELGL